MAESVNVVMPAHNEGRVVAGVVRRVRETLPDAQVVVVDDGSSDDTGSEAGAAGARVVTLPFNTATAWRSRRASPAPSGRGPTS